MAYHRLNGNFVDLNNCVCVGYAPANSRYLLKIPFLPNPGEKSTDGKEAFVIMLNPSSSAKANLFYNIPFSNLEDIDKTTNHVLNLLHRGVYIKANVDDKSATPIAVKTVYLLNLFPYFSPNPKDLNAIVHACGLEYKKNLNFIKHLLKYHKRAYVLIGWGKGGAGGIKRQIHTQAIKDVKTILKQAGNLCFFFNSNTGEFEIFNPNGKKLYVPHASSW